MYNSLALIKQEKSWHGEDLKSAYKNNIAVNLNYYYLFVVVVLLVTFEQLLLYFVALQGYIRRPTRKETIKMQMKIPIT